ncbi:phosphate signaling complex protein PhoU [Streptococcus sanguinis]|jgi:phosphate transport system regulatory protein phoU|uniref:Phosphate-specific transport system accessory protein PhoU n=8 Tax=Streptococcus sanguinis TaxID=1305 RepID=A3CMG3_STRSV|nr:MULTISPECIES: phosphate signaling complex protein PhoU [Streptococcus]PLA64674.1 phosphate transport system regulatory protein PhoU [Streptococcus salivarius]ABN44368.1 Phosphate transport system regulatory protein, putative [Streptococcus sanguinis SK36]EFX93991.1 phosphate transport system regulatory protein PhoU [Streptococcus sanguinis VMC66]EGD31910.1 phosphate transport system regulatory protein PhoU [Streptococcus sanguinis SK115]EGD38737.1 phosphate transport system regulatory prote
MLRVQFEEDLEKLHNQFYAMGNEVLSQINRTVRAFVTHDRELARQVIEDDAEVNEYEVKLEKKSLEIIALQQPVSQDLRTVITVLKASSDLERMGDHAVSIAKATVRMKGEVRIESVEDAISKMGRDVKNFVEETLNVYLNGNVDQAYAVAAMDEKINQYFDDIRDLATEEIKQNPELIVTGRDYFQVISYLERIGDYAKNICEWVVYFETGKIIEL